MQMSIFGEKFCQNSGILELMDDLGRALAATTENSKIYMLGGGNPPHIPALHKIFRQRMQEILSNEGEFERMIGNYDSPQGNLEFMEILASMFNEIYDWNITTENIAITGGSQSAFFILFNILAGGHADGTQKKILLPLAPEYIGYADQGICKDMFISYKPEIEHIDHHTFKYYIDFPSLKIDENIAAICTSRPTNPTGNVLTDEEMEHLDNLAQKNNIPLIIDNAYGNPFPNIIFRKSNLKWKPNMILTFSLSKVGLPSSRTGIVVANKKIIKAVSNANAILSLSNSSYGQYLLKDLIKTKEIVRISNEIINPFYKERSQKAIKYLHKYMSKDIPWRVHKSEGCLFLWLWFENLPITSKELYEKLKAKNVVIVPGEYFFPGMQGNWKHKYECIRVNYAMEPKDVECGIQIISEEIENIYKRYA